MKVTRVVTAEGRSGVVAHADAMNSGAARAVEYPSSGREMTTPAHETLDAAPPRHNRTRGRSSSSERELGAHLEEPWRRVALRLAGLLRVGSETWRKSAGDRGRHFAIAAMALATATSCGGARASKREVPPGWPPALPTAAVEAPTTSPAASAVSETTEPWSDGMSATAPNRFVEEKGIRFAYRAFGRKPGVPLLLLAPLRGTMDSWDPRLTDAFAQDRPLILFDAVGVGLTGGDTRTTVAEMATDAGAFIDALRELHFTDSDWLTGHVDVLGFSLGGFVAQQLALDRPDVVERVVLAGTAPRGGEGLGAPLPEVTKSLLADPQTPDDVLFLLFARSGTSRAAGQAFLARLGGRQQDRDAPISASAAAAQMRAMKGWGTAPAAGGPSYLSSIKQPVLVADGEADVVTRTNNSRFLAQNIPSARLVIYPDSAQGFLYQYPDAFAKDVAAFLRRL